MSALSHDIHIDVVLPSKRITGRKQLFQVLSEEASKHTNIPPGIITSGLVEREKIGRSGIGDGVAIPHLKFHNLKRPFTIFMRLEKPIDYTSQDDKPVDLVCFLLSPEHEGPFNLRRLSRISRMLRNNDLCEEIRNTKDEQVIRSLLTHSQDWNMAA